MELTTAQYENLVYRGKSYCRVLGVHEEHIDDVLGRSFIRGLRLIKIFPEDQQPEKLSKLWKISVYQSVCDEYRHTRHKHSEEIEQSYTENHEDRLNAQRILDTMFDILSDEDMNVLLNLVDCDFNVAVTANKMKQQRTNMYHIIRRIRTKIREKFPEFFEERPKKGKKQAMTWKTTGWSRFLSTVEVCDYREWQGALWSPRNNDRAYWAVVPGSTPSFQRMYLEVFNAIVD